MTSRLGCLSSLVVRPALVAMVACSAAVAAPAPALALTTPKAYTGEAGQLTTTTALLKGSVAPGTQPTTYYFQYGPTATYGQQTAPAPVAGTATVRVSTPLTGLAPASTYHYRLVATDGSTTSLGADQTFASRPIPLTFTIAPMAGPLPYGTPFAVSGVLAGTGAAGRELVLQGEPFPYVSGFKALTAPVSAGPDGSFTFALAGLRASTELRVATFGGTPAVSRALLARVAVRVSLHLARAPRPGFVRFYGTVTPGQLVTIVEVQRLGPAGRPLRVARLVVTGREGVASHFARSVRVRARGLYRAWASASGAQVSAHSAPVRLR